MTLSEAFDPRHNSLNAIRLALAIAVIISHSWPAGGYGADPRWGDQTLGEWAVAGFFVASGYLILGSRVSSRSIWDYLWRRLLRIYPGFIVCITTVALVIAPLSVAIDRSGAYNWHSGLSYIWSNVGIFIVQGGIEGTTTTAPYVGDWNAPLWTLFFEALCYVWIGVLVSIVPKGWLGPVLMVLVVICLAANIYGAVTEWGINSNQGRFFWLSGYFASGGIFYVYRDKIPLNRLLAAASLLLVIALATFHAFHMFAGLPLAYLVFFLAIKLPFARIGAKNDISYGMYIWAFPLQQVLGILSEGRDVPVFVFAAVSVLVTVPLALTSWLLVEKPAMRLKRLTNRTRISFPAGSQISGSPLGRDQHTRDRW
jgi:peptidoglycan/LPS O-acetylase OafA/YrhL